MASESVEESARNGGGQAYSPGSEPSISTSNTAQSSSTASASSGGAPRSTTPTHPSFRRQRAPRACETCHARKVRCDAASLGVPCTNCVAFSIDCKIPTPKRKKVGKAGEKDDGIQHQSPAHALSPSSFSTDSGHSFHQSPPPTAKHGPDGTPAVDLSEAQKARISTDMGTYAQFMKPKFARAPIKEAGRVAYLGESSNLSLLVRDTHGTEDTVHYPLPENIRGSRARLTELDTIEIDILQQRGAFLLPPRALCDELVEAYFKWIWPIIPVLNRSRFMRQYRDPKNPPSFLLLQAIFLAGSRVCTNPQLMDSNGSTTAAAMTFYKRAKALYDASYEDDRVTIVQALILMGWYWEGPEDVTKNVFYWSRVAIIVAQGSGIHRSVEHSQLSQADKRLWKRIWWTLFTRDRQVAVALGRPVAINTDDSDVDMVTEDDFIDDETGFPSEYPPDPLHVHYFLHHVKLCEIMGLVLAQQYSVASKHRRNTIDLVHSDLALADWMLHVPQEIKYHTGDKSKQNFWAALLHSTYYTSLCLLHRAHIPLMLNPNGLAAAGADENAYPSRNIAFRAAQVITSIVDYLLKQDELKFCPAFMVYSLFSAMIMNVYQMRSSNPSVVSETRERMKICMAGLKEISKVWVVARMVYTLFESIIGNKQLEERLQKSTERRYQKGRTNSTAENNKLTDPVKRKFDEMDLSAIGPGGPVPNVSYERSRPQTPAPSPAALSMCAPAIAPSKSTVAPGPDTIMGGQTSRSNTRPPTPFNCGYLVPATPPDLFLVTRSSPPISQSLWENFQPHQLFPEEVGITNSFAPVSGSLDLNLGTQPPSTQAPMNHMVQMPQLRPGSATGPIHQQQYNPQPYWGQHMDVDPAGMQTGSSPEDTWSNSSQGGVLPTMLNVEDWFNFFGLSGDLNAIDTEGTI